MVKSFVLIFWGKFRFFFAFILILLSICLFVFYSVKNDELYIPYFHSKFQKTCFNIELPKEYKDKVSFVVNGYETFDYPENKYLLNDSWLPISEEKNVNSLFAAYPFAVKDFKIKISNEQNEAQNIFDSIKCVVIFIGDKSYIFNGNDVRKFSKENKNDSVFVSVPVNDNPILNKYDKFLLNDFVVNFLSVFYLWQNYLIPWLLLIIGFSLLPRGKLRVNYGVLFGAIFLLSFLLRYNKLTNYPFYYDELIIIYCVGGHFANGLIGLFGDWGNPPLINLIYQIITNFQIEKIVFRTVFVLIGSVGTYAIYLLGKDRISKKVGIVSSFIYAVSVLAISYSQLCRSYILSFVLALFFVDFMFKFFEENKFKNLIGLAVLGILIINNHFFGCVFLLLNFIYGIFYLGRKKDFSKIKEFVITFLVIGCSFIPYLCFMIQRGLFKYDFECWIMVHSFSFVTNFFFGSIAFAVLIGVLCIISLIFRDYIFPHFSQKQNEFLNYLIFFIPIFVMSIYLINFWKLCFVESYFLMIYGLLILLLATFVEVKDKFKPFTYIIIFLFIYFQSANTSPLFVLSYRDVFKLLQNEAKKQNLVYFLSKDYSAHYMDRNNIVWLPDGVYNDYRRELDDGLEIIMDRFSEISPKSTFFISYNLLHNEDIDKFFNNEENPNYYMSVILTPHVPVVKFEPKTR